MFHKINLQRCKTFENFQFHTNWFSTKSIHCSVKYLKIIFSQFHATSLAWKLSLQVRNYDSPHYDNDAVGGDGDDDNIAVVGEHHDADSG